MSNSIKLIDYAAQKRAQRTCVVDRDQLMNILFYKIRYLIKIVKPLNVSLK